MRTLRVYNSYNFIDKDPIFDRLKTIIDGHNLTLKQVSESTNGDVSVATLRRWFYGKGKTAYVSTIIRVLIGLRKYDFKLLDEKIAKGKLKLISGSRK